MKGRVCLVRDDVRLRWGDFKTRKVGAAFGPAKLSEFLKRINEKQSLEAGRARDGRVSAGIRIKNGAIR